MSDAPVLRGTGIVACDCGWRGVPTFTCERVGPVRYDPLMGRVSRGCGRTTDRCPACGGPTR